MSVLQSIESRLPKFLRSGKRGAFLSVVLAGQLTYVSFEAFKGSLLLPLTQTLGIGVDQFGILMGYLGLAMFFYVPAGWINNRFTIRSILITWSAWRLVTFLILFCVPGLSFWWMSAIAITWGVWDAIGWPAVANGVAFMAHDEDSRGRGLAMGLLETIRRGLEVCMNTIIVIFMAIFPAYTIGIMRGFAIGYALLLIPLILALLRYVPRNAIAESAQIGDKKVGKNAAALVGLVRVLILPRVWLAGIASMCLYWTYVNLIYSSAPYLSLVYKVSDGMAGAFGIFSTGLVGVFAGLVSGYVADYLFKSSTKMLAVALSLAAVGAGLVLLLPKAQGAMWPAMLLLIVMAAGIFMGKAVILAPIAELELPQEINGSAMSVASFLAYASVFWANPQTSAIVEAHRDNPYVGYQQIFMITLTVALVGAACAITLSVLNARADRKAAQVAEADSAEVA